MNPQAYSDETYLPHHMTDHDRNERLYNYLLSLGLVVFPFSQEGKITHMTVSANLPSHTAPSASVRVPVQAS